MTKNIPTLTLPLLGERIRDLRAGQIVRLRGDVYTARDAAHKRLVACIAEGKPLPFPAENAAIYYCGPTPAREGEIVGSCGPTTSARMDDYTPDLLKAGVRVLIGKGKRSETVNRAIAEYGAVYFAAVGGAGALYKHAVTAAVPIAYPDLGCEAIVRLTLRDVELLVATDSYGNTCLK